MSEPQEDSVASMWKRAMLYLGLGPDDEYDDYDAEQPPPLSSAPVMRHAPQPEPPPLEPSTGAVRTLQRVLPELKVIIPSVAMRL